MAQSLAEVHLKLYSRDQLVDLIRAIDCVNLIRKLDRRVIYYIFLFLFFTDFFFLLPKCI